MCFPVIGFSEWLMSNDDMSCYQTKGHARLDIIPTLVESRVAPYLGIEFRIFDCSHSMRST